MKTQSINSPDDVARLESLVVASARATTEKLRLLLKEASGLEALAQLKFNEVGCDPLDEARCLNLVEQLNQAFTYLASLEAARWLLREHPTNVPLTLNLGTSSGADIESADGQISAETFAATHPGSNDKLNKDIRKVGATSATHRYVFYLSPAAPRPRPSTNGVTVVRLTHTAMASCVSRP